MHIGKPTESRYMAAETDWKSLRDRKNLWDVVRLRQGFANAVLNTINDPCIHGGCIWNTCSMTDGGLRS